MNRRRFLAGAGLAAAGSGLAARAATGAAADAATTGPDTGGGDPIQRALAERKGSLKGLPEPLALPRRTTAGLEPYTPRAEKPWNRQRAQYLIRRTMFGARKQDVDMALGKTPGEVVDMLLADSALPAAPGSWVTQNYVYDRLADNSDAENRQWLNDLRYWWTGLLVNQEFSIREKMVYFWHDHWSTETQDVIQPHFNYWFLDLFRKNFLGNFKQMVNAVTVSPAMLVYLDGRYNTKSRPNENYARELMELHTLGEGNGYTEDDVKAAARGLTGWTLKDLGALPNGRRQYSPNEAAYIASNHDATDKTFMGRTGNWRETDVIDIIFTERKNEVAHFICRKLYRQFVYEIADETIVDQLSAMLITNNWDLRPVVTTLLKSEHFFETANMGAHITSPLEQYIGAIRTLGISTTALSDIYNTCGTLGLQLLQPPNVKGWPEYRTWITASRLSSRWNATDLLIDESKKTNSKFPLDPIAFITAISTPTDPRKINKDVIELFFVLTLNDYQTEVLFEKFMSGWKDYEWDPTNPGAPDRVRNLIKAALRNNEAQLI